MAAQQQQRRILGPKVYDPSLAAAVLGGSNGNGHSHSNGGSNSSSPAASFTRKTNTTKHTTNTNNLYRELGLVDPKYEEGELAMHEDGDDDLDDDEEEAMDMEDEEDEDEEDEDEDGDAYSPTAARAVGLGQYRAALSALEDERDRRERALEALREAHEQLDTLRASSKTQLSLLRQELMDLRSSTHNNNSTHINNNKVVVAGADILRALEGENTSLKRRVAQLEAAVAANVGHNNNKKDSLVTHNSNVNPNEADLVAVVKEQAALLEEHVAAAAAAEEIAQRREEDVRRLKEVIRARDEAHMRAKDLAEEAAIELEMRQLKSDLAASKARAAELDKQQQQGDIAAAVTAHTTTNNNNNKKRITELRRGLEGIAAHLRAVREAARGVRGAASLLSTAAGETAGSLSIVVAKAVSAGQERALALYRRECKERKRLHNLLQELRGNIRVYCRVRPTLNNSNNNMLGVTFPGADMVNVGGSDGRSDKCFEFDRVFGPTSSQEDVFEEVRGLVTSVCDGYNVCIFAYGQTGSGKTFTMEGTATAPGVNVRALRELFAVAAGRADTSTHTINVSALEIYNESVRDLLVSNSASLEIRQGGVGVGTYVQGLTTEEVVGHADVERLMTMARKHRACAATEMNERSSRSHSLLSITVTARSIVNNNNNNNANNNGAPTTTGRLHLIDLAGSERVSRSEAAGDRLKEAQAINKSLSALGDVMAALGAKAAHVPYRNSKLTHLLQDSLGGESKALMLVQASPDRDDASETLCSLNFAARVATVELGQAKKNGSAGGSSEELSRCRRQALQEKLAACTNGNGVLSSLSDSAPSSTNSSPRAPRVSGGASGRFK
eukprot:jgi/Chlat1/894/Chrsp107S08614